MFGKLKKIEIFDMVLRFYLLLKIINEMKLSMKLYKVRVLIRH